MLIHPRQKGFTLIELLVAMVISSVVMAAIYATYKAQLRSHVTQQKVVEMHQNARAAMYILERELRMAGYDPLHSGVPQITNAQIHAIAFTMDITGGETDGLDNDSDGNIDAADLKLDNDGLDNDGDGLIDEDDEGDETRYGDGDVNDAFEQITYRLSNDVNDDGVADSLDCNLQRQYWDGTAWQPNLATDPDDASIAFGIDALNFVYLDADGNDLINYGLTPPQVPAADLNRIRSVQITIVARAGQNELQGLPGGALDTKVYMNQQNRPGDDWDIILPAPNDKFRRIVLTADVQCRNLGLD